MRRVLVVAITVFLAVPMALAAQKPPKKQKEKGHEAKSSEAQVTVVFTTTQREAASSYFVKEHGRGNCPPGLAKKQNGCLPPGQAKKRYAVGRPLPHGVIVIDLPGELSVRIGPAPAGYRYGIVDGDLVKLALGTMLVVDAIDGLVR